MGARRCLLAPPMLPHRVRALLVLGRVQARVLACPSSHCWWDLGHAVVAVDVLGPEFSLVHEPLVPRIMPSISGSVSMLLRLAMSFAGGLAMVRQRHRHSADPAAEIVWISRRPCPQTAVAQAGHLCPGFGLDLLGSQPWDLEGLPIFSLDLSHPEVGGDERAQKLKKK